MTHARRGFAEPAVSCVGNWMPWTRTTCVSVLKRRSSGTSSLSHGSVAESAMRQSVNLCATFSTGGGADDERGDEDLKAHPLSGLFPLLEGDQFDALVSDIKTHG